MLRRVIPGTWKGRLLLVLGIGLIAGAVYGINHYFSAVPDQLADDYRKTATKAVDRMTDDMDRVYASFDEYLVDSVRPRGYFQNVDDLDELRRRVRPLLDDTEEALLLAQKRITAARKSIKAEQDALRDSPSSWMLDDSESLKAVDEAVRHSNSYARSTEPYLKNFERFIEYDKERVDILRRSWEPRPIEELSADASLETFKATVADELTFNQGLRARLLDLEPHPDTEALRDLSLEDMTIVVDYYEDLKAAFEALSVAGLDQADKDFVEASKRLRGKESPLLQEFAASSSLQKQSRKLGDRGDKLEEEIAGLGTGDGDPPGGDLYRRPAPPDPKPKSNEGDKSVS